MWTDLRQFPSRRAMLLALAASLLTVLAPVGHELGHLWGDVHERGHEEGKAHADSHPPSIAHHAPEAASVSHGECDGWSLVAEGHKAHSERQFETASSLHHHPHGLCPSSIAGSDAAAAALLRSTSRVDPRPKPEFDWAAVDSALARPPSRGPPVVAVC